MRKRRKPLRFWIFLFLFIGILGWGVIQITDMVRGIFGKEKVVFHKIHTVSYQEEEKSFAHPFQTGIAVYDQEKIYFYDEKGQKRWMISKKIDSLIAACAKDIFFCGDKNTGEITAIDRSGKTLWSAKLDAFLVKLKSNEGGYLAVHVQNQQNEEKIIVLNPKGKITGEISLTEGSILDFAVSEDDIIGISAVSIANNELSSYILFYSVEGEVLGGSQEREEIISNVFFDSKSNLFSIGTGNVRSIDQKGKLRWSEGLPGMARKIAWNPQGWAAMYLSDYKNTILDPKNQNFIWFIDSSGKEIGRISVEENLLGLDSRGNHLAAFTERTVYIYEKNGKFVAEKKISNDVQKVYLLSSNRLAVLFKNKLEIFEWKDR
ncbi:MAG TPA: hypothetical protein GX503_05385 [Clostridiales bacterium]|nr:hypothetical protein [Clostridiales bacterium]